MKELSELISHWDRERPIIEPYNNPRRLVSRLRGEVDELETEVLTENMPGITDELADVLLYGLRLALRLKIDPEQAIRGKLEKNTKRFPSELFQEGDFEQVYLQRKKELGELSDSQHRTSNCPACF